MTEIKKIDDQELENVAGGSWEEKYTPEESARSRALRQNFEKALMKAARDGSNPEGVKALEEYRAFLAEMEKNTENNITQ